MEKFLADESVDFRIIRSLRNDGYQVEAIVELESGIDDDDVLKLAMELEAILLTEDKDFGELTFRLQKPNKGIILIRMSGELIERKIKKLKEVLAEHLNELSGKFTVISSQKVRIRAQKK
jgi:predicted nuclease of predicted toxin-antitoxin system